jgi:anti-sigma B factor antagonist
MSVQVKEENDIIIITVKGDIEIYTLEDFKKVLSDVGHSFDKNIVIDVSKVNFIDSSGIGALISLYKLQNKKSRKLIIRNASPEIHNILKLTTLTDVLGME